MFLFSIWEWMTVLVSWKNFPSWMVLWSKLKYWALNTIHEIMTVCVTHNDFCYCLRGLPLLLCSDCWSVQRATSTVVMSSCTLLWHPIWYYRQWCQNHHPENPACCSAWATIVEWAQDIGTSRALKATGTPEKKKLPILQTLLSLLDEVAATSQLLHPI